MKWQAFIGCLLPSMQPCGPVAHAAEKSGIIYFAPFTLHIYFPPLKMHGIKHLAAAILKLQALEGFFSFLQIQQQILVNNKIT